MKKVLSLLLSLTMLLSIVSIVDFSAYADTLTTGKCGDNVTYSFDTSTGMLKISGTGKMTDYSYHNYSPFYQNTNIESVSIEDGVTSIGDFAFCHCKSLTNVTIGNSVTSIGECAFLRCASLISITIPNSVTSIENEAFEDCTSLKSIEVSGNNKNYSSLDGVLFNKDKSKLITYPAGKADSEYAIPNSVTSIDYYAFNSCTSLTSITIPNSVTGIGGSAFYGCTSLASITIPNSVTSIGGSAFYGCTSLASITIPNSVTSIGYFAFNSCTSLTSITIPDSVTSIGEDAFRSCTSLTSITIPDSVTSIGSSAFYNCKSLTKVDYNGTVSQWKSIKGYDNVSKIIKCTDGIVGNGNTVTIDNLKYKIYDDTATLVGYTDSPENLVISKNISYEGYTLNVISIGESAFKGCTSLTSVTIGNSVTSIGRCAFDDCTSLTSITIPNSVTSIGNSAFYNCTSLTNITIPGSVTSIGDFAFYNCTSLTNVTIPDSITSIGDYAFYNTAYYNDKSNWDNGVLYISDCLIDTNDNFNSITDYAIKDGTRIIASSAFENCTSLTSVTIPDSVTSIGDNAFRSCTSLKNIIVLSSDCKFGSYIVGKEVKIYGYTNSTANEYAVLKGNEFIKIYCNDYGLEHIYSEKVLENPTCKNNGKISYTCDRCSKIYTDTIPALGHNYVSKVIKQPTCTEKGTTRYTCSRCGDYYDKDDIAALGHNYVSKVLTQPTCTEKGVTRYTCTRCNNYYDKKDIEELGHDTKIVERVEPTLTEDGFYRVECQRDGCGYSSSHPLEQLTLGYNQKVKSNGSDTYKIEMDKSGYLIFDFEGESKEWDINIYDEDYNKIDTLKPVYKEFYKKSYLQISLGSNVPNKNQIVALFAGKYYVEIDRLNNATNDNFSGNYTFSIDYSPANETIKETKNDFYYDAPTAKNIELNKTYNGFLGAKYACYNYVGNPILTTDERDAYKIEIPKGSGLSQFSVTLSSKAFAPLGSNCTLILYNSEFEPYDGFKPLTVSLNSTLNETIYLYEGTYYIAVVNDNSPIEYSFTTTFKPQGTFTCVEHKGKLVNTVNPTCTQNGYNSYVCQICGAKYNEIIPAYGHNAVIDYEVAPTLVSSGLTRGSHCSICGAVITPQTVIPQISASTQPIVTPNTTVKAVAKPKSAKIKKVKAAKKAVSVEWKKVSGVKGYQIQVATDKKFKKNKKTATVKKQKTTKVTIKKLKAKKKYYVRIRTYKTVKGKKVYSSWSKVKTVKTK